MTGGRGSENLQIYVASLMDDPYKCLFAKTRVIFYIIWLFYCDKKKEKKKKEISTLAPDAASVCWAKFDTTLFYYFPIMTMF